jgi:glycosyltransferase involved in cell wall biosynthesis
MTLLSVVVPAYNAQDYLRRALDSVVGLSPEIEVIVVDDGSTDETADIARGYVTRYPGLVRLVSKPNGGHGSAINTGIDVATGLYFKVVDADDWLDREALAEVLRTLRTLADGPQQVDLLVSNFVYEKVGKRTKTAVRYTGALPRGRVMGWNRTRRFAKRQYMMMHALTYRTALLREVGLRLPEHTFYVDSLYALVPLHRVTTLYYLDVDLYRYFIGRPDQSVQEAVMLRRLDQQLRVNRLMLEHVTRTRVADRRLRHYLMHYLELTCAVSSILLIRAGTRATLAEKDLLWAQLRAADPWMYRRVRWSVLGQISNLPGPAGRRASILAYRVAQRAIGFS